MRDYIKSQIQAKQDQLQEIVRQKLTIDAELRVLEDMLAHLDLQSRGGGRENDNSPINTKENGAPPSKIVERASSIPSEMTPAWRKILCGLDGLGRTFGASDIVNVGESVGVPTKLQNARSQLYQWDKKHIISRSRKGKYRIAQKGTDVIRKIEDPDVQTSRSP